MQDKALPRALKALLSHPAGGVDAGHLLSPHGRPLRGMLQIEYELKKMCREHRVDGRTTQADRLELAATVGT